MAFSSASGSSINSGVKQSKAIAVGSGAFTPINTQQSYTYSSTVPIGWYIANDLSTTAAGTTLPNRGSGTGGVMVSLGTGPTGSGGTVATWRNGQKAFTNVSFWSSFISSKLTQGGPLTWMIVAQHNGSNFSPFAGVGEWWGNYSPAINAWYYHGLYGNWGGSSASPAVIGGTKASGTYTFRVFQNGSFAQDTPGPYTDGDYIKFSPGGLSNQYIAEMLVWNANLSDSEINSVTSALRSKYAF